ncbi:MAG: hypothetical protein ACHQQQ_11340 [Bacteroidota bacterium]
MNRFVTNRSLLYLVFAWVFIFSHIMDAVNITDLFSGITTIHFEEGDGIQCADQMYAENYIQINSAGDSESQKNYTSPQKQGVIKFIILDQDSPSLAATSFTSSNSSVLTPRQDQLFVPRIFSTESLYLHNRTLLL